MVGLSSRDAAGRWSSTPAIAERRTGGSGWDVVVAGKALRPSLQQERWMCPLDPSSPAAVFARNLACRPIDEAWALTAIYSIVASSADLCPGLAVRCSP